MDNFKIIYKISANAGRESLDYDEFDKSLFNPELLGISENRLNAILKNAPGVGI